MIIPVRAADPRPAPPYQVADEAQLWAREKGRRFGRVEWNRMLGCWCAHFGRKSTDPVLRAWQAQLLPNEPEPTESVMLREWDEKQKRYVPLSLEDLGAQGLRALLEEADVTTGRGKYNSLQEGIEAVRLHNQRVRQNQSAMAREAGAEIDWLHAKRLRGEPIITAGIDLTKGT